MYTSSLTFFQGIKASFKQCIQLVNLSSKCEWLLPAVALQNTTTARLLLSFSSLEDPNVDLTDNKLSLARNGLNVAGFSISSILRAVRYNIYQKFLLFCLTEWVGDIGSRYIYNSDSIKDEYYCNNWYIII